MKPPKPADSSGAIRRECLAVRLRLINRVVTNLYDEALRPHGLRVSQMNVLVVVAESEVARPGDVCRLLRMDKSTLSRDVARMRANGWLEAGPGADGRSRVLRVTVAGADLLRRVAPAWRQAQDRTREVLGAAGAAAVVAMADAVWAEG